MADKSDEILAAIGKTHETLNEHSVHMAEIRTRVDGIQETLTQERKERREQIAVLHGRVNEHDRDIASVKTKLALDGEKANTANGTISVRGLVKVIGALAAAAATVLGVWLASGGGG